MKTKLLVDRAQATVESNLNGGFTRIKYNHGRHSADVPTSLIPSHLRGIGSSVLLTMKNIDWEGADATALREAIKDMFAVEDAAQPALQADRP